MTIKVFTFGWSPEFVIRPLVSRGVSKDDTIVLIANKPETDYAKKRAEEAVGEVIKFLKTIKAGRIQYVEIELDDDIIAICRRIVKVIKDTDRKDEPIEFYLTGGMRVLVLATMLVARLLSLTGRKVIVETSREDRPVSFEIPIQLLNLSPRITSSQLEILRYLKAVGEGTFEDLAVGRSEVTVRKHLTKLRGMGLATFSARGRKQIYKLTPLGELLLDILG